MSGVAGAILQLAAKLAEEVSNFKRELLSRMKKTAELFVLEKVCKKSTVIVRSVLPVIFSVPFFLVRKMSYFL